VPALDDWQARQFEPHAPEEAALCDALTLFTDPGAAVLAKLDAPTRDIAASHAARLGLVGTAAR
jgi:hypothetical protein